MCKAVCGTIPDFVLILRVHTVVYLHYVQSRSGDFSTQYPIIMRICWYAYMYRIWVLDDDFSYSTAVSVCYAADRAVWSVARSS